ncbi:MAG: 4Fe-4S ferredoxin [Desulfobacterales bacterium SG8_35]|nr:MAG: 4Fe-4S ferredoxin [Desulfobacterales bacterium SG8_35]
MKSSSATKVFVFFVLLIALTAALSQVSTSMWGGKPEKLPESRELVFKEGMSVMEFGSQNNVPNPVLKKVLGLETKSDLQKPIESFGFNKGELQSRIDKATALEAEQESKNWVKIPVKFGAWFIFLGIVFVMVRKGKVTPRTRKALYLAAVILFGIILGSDPSPMGTVKDALHLYGAKKVIFPPRMIALSVFLLIVFLANKFICSWGCQLGTLQDLIFRLNRNAKDTKGILPQYKMPFLLSNGIRVSFFIVFTIIAFGWALDIIDPIDPFKVYKPGVLTAAGAGFLGVVLVGSLFIYRPWCQLFCPFGLVGWLVEKISIFKIKVDYETCIACEACAGACPSTVMGAILKQDRTIPDCFACGTCMNVCPTDSIKLQAGKRSKPPADKFAG